MLPSGLRTANTTENLLLYPPDVLLHFSLLCIGMICLKVPENIEERYILLDRNAKLANLNLNHLPHKILC